VGIGELMNQVEAVKKATEIYRQNPTTDGTISQQRQTELKGIIGCVTSQAHLQETLGGMRFQGYSSEGKAYALFLGRLAVVESKLKQYEEVYGKITSLPYIT
jgi:hypothetical protein